MRSVSEIKPLINSLMNCLIDFLRAPIESQIKSQIKSQVKTWIKSFWSIVWSSLKSSLWSNLKDLTTIKTLKKWVILFSRKKSFLMVSTVIFCTLCTFLGQKWASSSPLYIYAHNQYHYLHPSSYLTHCSILNLFISSHSWYFDFNMIEILGLFS